MTHKVMAIDFQHSNPGEYYDSEEKFKQACMDQVQNILKQRIEFGKDPKTGATTEDELPTLPMFVNVLFENGSYAATFLFPESDTDKMYLLTGVKKMLAGYHKTKKIKSIFLIIEAWMGEIDTKQMKQDNPFAKEMTEEQLQRRIHREWKENKIKKSTKIVCEYQIPVIIEDKQHTKVDTTVYNLFEHVILMPDETITLKMNSDHNDILAAERRRKPWFNLFTEYTIDETAVADKDVLNFNIYTAAEFLKQLNKLM